MNVESQSFSHGERIPAEFGFAQANPETHVTLSSNRNPHLAWTGAPEGTKSFCILCIDDDVPSVPDDVNVEGREVEADLPRVEFVHWLMVDVSASVTEIEAGSCSDGVVAGGKSDPAGPAGSRQGQNNFTQWFAGDADMGGSYLGYDGPAPPWNDQRMHHYHFTVMALDVESLEVSGEFVLADVMAATEGHVLGQATLTGTYTQNPKLL